MAAAVRGRCAERGRAGGRGAGPGRRERTRRLPQPPLQNGDRGSPRARSARSDLTLRRGAAHGGHSNATIRLPPRSRRRACAALRQSSSSLLSFASEAPPKRLGPHEGRRSRPRGRDELGSPSESSAVRHGSAALFPRRRFRGAEPCDVTSGAALVPRRPGRGWGCPTVRCGGGGSWRQGAGRGSAHNALRGDAGCAQRWPKSGPLRRVLFLAVPAPFRGRPDGCGPASPVSAPLGREEPLPGLSADEARRRSGRARPRGGKMAARGHGAASPPASGRRCGAPRAQRGTARPPGCLRSAVRLRESK